VRRLLEPETALSRTAAQGDPIKVKALALRPEAVGVSIDESF
jgi:hypothetical protein